MWLIQENLWLDYAIKYGDDDEVSNIIEENRIKIWNGTLCVFPCVTIRKLY